MALSEPRILFGVHSVTPYKRTDGTFYGTLKVLGGSSLALNGDLISLYGGSQRFPWAVEDGTLTAELEIVTREYPDFLFELFLGKAPTDNAAEATGSTTTITNVLGTSVVASTGIASVSALSASEADMKFGIYIVKVVSATTVDVFASTDVDFARGTDASYENDLLKITASPLTITQSAAVTVPDFGIELTGDSGTIAMTTGDTAEFYVKPINSGSMDVDIGSTTDVFPEFGAIVIAQQRGNAQMMEVELYKVKGLGMGLGFSSKEFSESPITAQAFYDSTKDKVFSIRHVKPS